MTRILISGDRNWYCIALAREVIKRLLARYNEIEIMHGACEKNGEMIGVDAAFDAAALEAGLEPKRRPADWYGLGDAAGPIRNLAMLKEWPEALAICVHKNISWSRGTKDFARKALKAEMKVWLIDNDDCKLKKLITKMLIGNYEKV